MASNTREIRIVAAVECPRCHAVAGKPCYVHGISTTTQRGAPQCHPERRAAWQESKRTQETS